MREKSFFILILCFGLIYGFWQVVPLKAEEQNSPDTRTLIVYYTRTGHTKMVAEKLAKKFNADLEQLIDTHKRTGAFGVSSAAKDAIFENTTAIVPLKHNLKDYNVILIGSPTWSADMVPAVRTFVIQNDLSGKKIGLFGLYAHMGVERMFKEVSDIIAKGENKAFPTMPVRDDELSNAEVLSKKIDVFYNLMQKSQ
jgi:flavodoxin